MKNKPGDFKILTIYSVLAIALVWLYPLCVNILKFSPVILIFLGGWIPNISAFIVLGLIAKDKAGILNLLRGWLKWRLHPKWYIFSAFPLFTVGLIIFFYLIISPDAKLPITIDWFTIIIFIPLFLITAAMGEELGWRGFMLPRLLKHFNALKSSIIIGVIWAIFHIPLFLVPDTGFNEIPFWVFTVSTLSLSVIYNWLVINTNGSMLIVTLTHFFGNFSLSFFTRLELPAAKLYYAYAGINMLIAIGILIFTGKSLTIKSVKTSY